MNLISPWRRLRLLDVFKLNVKSQKLIAERRTPEIPCFSGYCTLDIGFWKSNIRGWTVGIENYQKLDVGCQKLAIDDWWFWIEYLTPDTGNKTIIIEHWTSDIGHWTLDIRHQTLGVGHWTSDIKSLEIGYWMLETGYLTLDIWYLLTHVRFHNWCLIVGVACFLDFQIFCIKILMLDIFQEGYFSIFPSSCNTSVKKLCHRF